jgi:hypothetical protein
MLWKYWKIHTFENPLKRMIKMKLKVESAQVLRNQSLKFRDGSTRNEIHIQISSTDSVDHVTSSCHEVHERADLTTGPDRRTWDQYPAPVGTTTCSPPFPERSGTGRLCQVTVPKVCWRCQKVATRCGLTLLGFANGRNPSGWICELIHELVVKTIELNYILWNQNHLRIWENNLLDAKITTLPNNNFFHSGNSFLYHAHT